jgi:hypothetical protein
MQLSRLQILILTNHNVITMRAKIHQAQLNPINNIGINILAISLNQNSQSLQAHRNQIKVLTLTTAQNLNDTINHFFLYLLPTIR